MVWYERAIKQRATEKLEESTAEFWTKIYVNINEAKIFELDANIDATEIHRDR